MEQKLVLINDDDLEILALLKNALESSELKVVTTTSGDEALKKIQELHPHLIITDIKMPGMSGTELAEELFKRDIFIPVIMISAYTRPDDDTYYFIEKPFEPKKLCSFVFEYLDEIRDMQLLKNVSRKKEINLNDLGKVVVFYPDRGWGLLRVIGMDRLLYVNAADCLPKGEFKQLYKGQVVNFSLKSGARGPRANEVKVVYDEPRKTVRDS